MERRGLPPNRGIFCTYRIFRTFRILAGSHETRACIRTILRGRRRPSHIRCLRTGLGSSENLPGNRRILAYFRTESETGHKAEWATLC